LDKYEYNLKFDQIKSLCSEENYEAAAEIADTINWTKIRNVNALVKAGEVYENVQRYDEAHSILLMAYDRSPIGRMIIYRLAELAIKMNNYEEAEDYYHEFVEIAPRDNLKYVLQYEILKAKGAGYPELISVLEKLKEQEYTEEWSYELAYLYHKANMISQCVEACDELILWFGDGPYVERALELKMLYQPLTKTQEEKYRTFRMEKEGITRIHAEEMERAGEYGHKPVNIPQVTLSPERFNTINLQEEIAKGMQQIMEATEKTTVSDTMDSIRKAVEDIPYLQLPAQGETVEDEETHIETDEEIDGSLKINFQELLDEDSDGQISMVVDEQQQLERQITGQMTIADVLEEWEKTKRAAETAMKEAEERRLESMKARALQEAGVIMDRLTGAMPKLDAGMQPVELLKEEYEAKDRKDEEPEHTGSGSIGSAAVGAAGAVATGALGAAAGLAGDIATNVEEAESAPVVAGMKALHEIGPSLADHIAAAAEQQRVKTQVEEPQIEEPQIAEAQIEEPQVEEPQIEEAQITEPQIEEPQITEPQIAEAQIEEAQIEEPQIEESQITEPQIAEAQVEEAQITEPQIEEPQIAEAQSEESKIEEPQISEAELEEALAQQIAALENTENSAAENPIVEENIAEASVTETEEATVPTEEMTDDMAKLLAQPTIRIPSIQEFNADVKFPSGILPRTIDPEATAAKKAAEIPEIELPKDVIEDMAATAMEDRAKEQKEPLTVRKLTAEQKAIFSYFVPVKGMEDQLCLALSGAIRHLKEDKTAKTGNMIIQGGRGCGKTVLATSIIKVLQKETGKLTGKIGKINADALNRKDVQGLLEKVKGGVLIIERAGELERETAVKIALLMQNDSSGTLVLMEDTSKGIRKALALDGAFASLFSEKVDVPIFTTDELVSFARSYSEELGYEIDEMAILALYKRISNIQKLDQATTLTEVKEIVDEAIDREQHGGLKKAFSILTASRYTDDDRIVLRESVFE